MLPRHPDCRPESGISFYKYTEITEVIEHLILITLTESVKRRAKSNKPVLLDDRFSIQGDVKEDTSATRAAVQTTTGL